MTFVTINGYQVELSNLNKVMWPNDGITKTQIIDYFIKISPYMLPHLKDRPIVLTRYPHGIQGESFYQKNTPEYAPEWVTTHSIYSEHSQREIRYCVVDKLATLVWLANQAAFEIHPYLSRIETLRFPDFAVLDLDPMENSTWEDVCQAAETVHYILNELKLKGYPKTSGSTGLQIFVPLQNSYSYAEVREFAHFVSRIVNTLLPQSTTLIRKVKDRGGRLYLDYLQNVLGKTLASVYCIRPKPMAPVSCPVTWAEIEGRTFTPQTFNMRTMISRLEKVGDLFAPVLSNKQRIDHILEITNSNPTTGKQIM